MSKRMKALESKIDSSKTYSIEEAIALAKETSTVKFDASVEIHINMGIDPRKSDQQIRSVVVLPHGTGKTQKIAAFVSEEKEKEAKEAGADLVYNEEDIKKIKTTGKIDFDVAITTPDMMPKLASIAKILGPKGLMPNPKTETISPNLKKMIGDLKKGKVTFKNDDTSNLHLSIGKVSFDDAKLKENYDSFMETLIKLKPTSIKGAFIKSLTMTTSMGPAISISTK